MGIGKAKGNGRVVVVANYRPAGNFIGNVFRSEREVLLQREGERKGFMWGKFTIKLNSVHLIVFL
jgi:hypothetical protein